jgi:hypothetical protein
MGLLDWIQSGRYDEADSAESDKRVRGHLWSENHSSQSAKDRQRTIAGRAAKADKTLQDKLAKQAKAMQAEAKKAEAKKAAAAARRAAGGTGKGGWW